MIHIEKLEECPRCGEVKKWLYDAQICGACDYGNRIAPSKHRERAISAMASHLCSTDYTDGFCCPRDGECRRPGHPTRDCVRVARGLMGAIESVGCKAVWSFDKEQRS